MFGKKRDQTENQHSSPVKPSDLARPKYHHPKILLIDLKDDLETILETEGYNVTAGSFGMPYKVPRDDKLSPLIVNGYFHPILAEREIIIIDLIPTETLGQPIGEKHMSPGESDWWASCSEGMIDPRPRPMMSVKNDFDKIFEHGGDSSSLQRVRTVPESSEDIRVTQELRRKKASTVTIGYFFQSCVVLTSQTIVGKRSRFWGKNFLWDRSGLSMLMGDTFSALCNCVKG